MNEEATIYTGEKCNVCKQPAAHKIGEEFSVLDPRACGHNLTGYLCEDHFNMVIRPYMFKLQAIPTKGMVLEILGKYGMLPDPTEKHIMPSREQKMLEEINELFGKPFVPNMSAIEKLRETVKHIVEVNGYPISVGEYAHGKHSAANEILDEMSNLWPNITD